MADLADMASENAIVLEAAMIANSRKITPAIVANGKCFNCGFELENPNARWCDAECRDEWQKENSP